VSKERLLQGKSVVFIGGGWAELDTRIRSGGLELGVAEALVLREPTFPGSPHYVFGERDQKELFKLFTEESVPPERRWLNDRLGLDIAPVVGVGERLPGAVVIDHGQFTGVWLEHRGMLDWLRERLARIAGGLLVARYRVEQAGEREEHAPPVEAGRGTEPTVGRADEQGAAAGEEDEAEDAFAPLPRPAESQTANGGGGEPEAAANGAGDGRDGDPVIRRTPHLSGR